MIDPVVLVAPSADVLARWPAPSLTAVEQSRAARLPAPGDFVAAHLLAREAVGALIGRPASDLVLVQHCAGCGGDHGRPEVDGVPDVTVSWSHTAGHVAAAASRRAIGVDLEALGGRRTGGAAMLARTATVAEAAAIAVEPDPSVAFLRMWVAKEALVKVGAIELADFARTDVRDGVHAGFALAVQERGPVVVGTAVPA